MTLKPHTCLWFDGTGLEAAEFYTTLLPDSHVDAVHRPGPDGPPILVEFTLGGTPYSALNGGPHNPLTPAASIVVQPDTQAEADRLWDALSDGGQELRCGWVTDRFGLSWQIVPKGTQGILFGSDAEGAKRAYTALQGMIRIDTAALQAAYDGA